MTPSFLFSWKKLHEIVAKMATAKWACFYKPLMNIRDKMVLCLQSSATNLKSDRSYCLEKQASVFP